MTNDKEVILKSFIDKHKNNLYKHYNVLRILKETYSLDIKLGRRSICDMLKKKGVYFSEQEVRTILNDLSIFEMIYVSKGRGGTSITNFGMQAYDVIIKKYKEYTQWVE